MTLHVLLSFEVGATGYYWQCQAASFLSCELVFALGILIKDIWLWADFATTESWTWVSHLKKFSGLDAPLSGQENGTGKEPGGLESAVLRALDRPLSATPLKNKLLKRRYWVLTRGEPAALTSRTSLWKCWHSINCIVQLILETKCWILWEANVPWWGLFMVWEMLIYSTCLRFGTNEV